MSVPEMCKNEPLCRFSGGRGHSEVEEKGRLLWRRWRWNWVSKAKWDFDDDRSGKIFQREAEKQAQAQGGLGIPVLILVLLLSSQGSLVEVHYVSKTIIKFILSSETA